jgi:hypothetical protein
MRSHPRNSAGIRRSATHTRGGELSEFRAVNREHQLKQWKTNVRKQQEADHEQREAQTNPLDLALVPRK